MCGPKWAGADCSGPRQFRPCERSQKIQGATEREREREMYRYICIYIYVRRKTHMNERAMNE